jgi:hypothetical protein
MKVKLFFIYEEQENAIALTFKELMNFPKECPSEYFPTHYFTLLLKFLTLKQKSTYLAKMRKENRNDKTDIQSVIIAEQIEQEKHNIAVHSLEVDDLVKVDVLQFRKDKDSIKSTKS